MAISRGDRGNMDLLMNRACESPSKRQRRNRANDDIGEQARRRPECRKSNSPAGPRVGVALNGISTALQ